MKVLSISPRGLGYSHIEPNSKNSMLIIDPYLTAKNTTGTPEFHKYNCLAYM